MKPDHRLASLLLTVSLNAAAQTDPLWLRNAAISPDGLTIAFCYQGDIWRVPAAGGEAVALTTNDAYDHTPVWSHDGARIAFSSTRHGSNDVFVMPSTGGVPTRLTFHGNLETASDFTPDNSAVIFYGRRQDDVKNQQFPVGGLGELYTVPSNGGRPLQVSTIAMERAMYNTARATRIAGASTIRRPSRATSGPSTPRRRNTGNSRRSPGRTATRSGPRMGTRCTTSRRRRAASMCTRCRPQVGRARR